VIAPQPQVILDLLCGQVVGGQKFLPARIRRAVHGRAGRKIDAHLMQPLPHLLVAGLRRVHVFLVNLLLDQRSADEPLQRAVRGKLPGDLGIKDGKPLLAGYIAPQNRAVVHHRHHSIDHRRACRPRCLRGHGRGRRSQQQARGLLHDVTE